MHQVKAIFLCLRDALAGAGSRSGTSIFLGRRASRSTLEKAVPPVET